MGVLSFIEGLQQQKLAAQQAELERQARLNEIAARGSQAIAEQNNAARLAAQAVQNEVNRQWMTSAKSDIRQREDLAANLVHQGMDPQEALVEAAHQQHMIRAEPEVVKATSARAKNEFNAGLTPLMGTLAKASTQADITGAKEREAQGLLGYNTNLERMTSAPMAARAEDTANTAGANMRAAAANSAIPLLPRATSAQQLSDIAKSNLAATQAGQQQKVISGVDPALQSAAENAASRAAAARSGLETSSGGLLTPGVGNTVLANPIAGSPAQPGSIADILQKVITSAITNRNSAPGVVTSPSTLPARQPVNLKNLGITLPME